MYKTGVACRSSDDNHGAKNRWNEQGNEEEEEEELEEKEEEEGNEAV